MGIQAKPSISISLSRHGGSEVRGSPSTVGVLRLTKALQLRHDDFKTQMVAAQAANWHEATRESRNDAAMAVQYGEQYGERATQKQPREKEAEG
jgi:hypothetical protein